MFLFKRVTAYLRQWPFCFLTKPLPFPRFCTTSVLPSDWLSVVSGACVEPDGPSSGSGAGVSELRQYVFRSAANLQTQYTVGANLNSAGIYPGIRLQLKLHSNPFYTELDFQFLSLHYLQLVAVGTLRYIINRYHRNTKSADQYKQHQNTSNPFQFHHSISVSSHHSASCRKWCQYRWYRQG